MKLKDHWNKIYQSQPVQQLGWYEENPGPCLEMLARCNLGLDDAILDVGVGASTFIDRLLDEGYRNVMVVDISERALETLQHRLGKDKAARIQWLVDDLTQPQHLLELRNIAFWHDRACLHFFIEESHQQAYFKTLKQVVQPGGYVMIAVFSLEGAERCSGLDVLRYDENMLAQGLGQEFELITSFPYTYYQPSGNPRPYVYTLFRHNAVIANK